MVSHFLKSSYVERDEGQLTTGNGYDFGNDTSFVGTDNYYTHDDELILDERSLGFLESSSHPRAPAAGTTVSFSFSATNVSSSGVTVTVRDPSSNNVDSYIYRRTITSDGSFSDSFRMPDGAALIRIGGLGRDGSSGTGGDVNYTLTLGTPGGDTGGGGGNRGPTANKDFASTPKNQAVSINVLANDTDPDNDTLSLSISTQTAGHGKISVVNGRVVYEPDPGFVGVDTFNYGISDGHSHTAIGVVEVTVTGPPDPTVSSSSASVTEGDAGTKILRFDVTLSASSTDTVTVQYATQGDGTANSATAGGDYNATSGTLTFAPGETSKPIEVVIRGDYTPENSETFSLVLSNPTNAKLPGGVASQPYTGTITDDDTVPEPASTMPNGARVIQYPTGQSSGVHESYKSQSRYAEQSDHSYDTESGVDLGPINRVSLMLKLGHEMMRNGVKWIKDRAQTELLDRLNAAAKDISKELGLQNAIAKFFGTKIDHIENNTNDATNPDPPDVDGNQLDESETAGHEQLHDDLVELLEDEEEAQDIVEEMDFGVVGVDHSAFGVSLVFDSRIDRPQITAASGHRDGFYGSAGNDTIDAGDKNDYLYGAAGNDKLTGGSGADTIIGGEGNDRLIGGTENDRLWGNAGTDTLDGDDGDDFLDGGLGADKINGGIGSDTVSYVSHPNAVIIDLAGQVTWDGVANDTLTGIENALGSPFNDTIYGDATNNVLDGGTGGADSINGGGGTDTVSYAHSSRGVIIDLGGQVTWDGVSNDTLSSIESAIGSSFNDTFYSNALANRFDGGAGIDTVSYAGSSTAVLIDLGGQITFDGVVNDTLVSIENATGSSLGDTFYSNAQANRFDGGGGIDTVNYSASSAGVIVDLFGQVTWDGTVNDTLVSIENATGSGLSDTFYSNSLANRFDGGGGTDTVSYASASLAVTVDMAGGTAREGNVTDTLVSIETVAGSGLNDTFISSALANRFEGGSGSDTVSYVSSTRAVLIDLGGQVTWDGVVNDTLSSIENATGSPLADQLYGDAGNNILDGGLGADQISGGGGIDTVNYGSSTRAVTVDLIAQTGFDGVETDTLSSIENAIGSSLNDTFSSNALTNRFDGGGGTDTVSYVNSNTGVIIDLGGQITWDGTVNDTLSSIESAIGSSLNDTFYSNALANRFDGGGGSDTVSYAGSSKAVIVDLGGQITFDGAVNDTLSSIENAVGSGLNDTFYSNVQANRFDGGGGTDTVSYAGSSTGVIIDLIGQTTFDGTVNDTLSSIENAIGSSSNDTFYSNTLANRFDGGGGTDTVSYSGSSKAVIIDLIGQTASDGTVTDTLSSIENAIGSSLSDTFTSNAMANRFDGGGGAADTVSYAGSNSGVIIDLIGQTTFDGTVNDTLSSIENAIGSSLGDTFYSNTLANRFDGGGGADTVNYSGASAGVIIDLIGQTTWDGTANDTLSSIENATGSSLGDTFYSNASANRFDGGGGADTVNYSGSSKAVIIDLGGQVTFDGAVNDTLSSIENATGSAFGDTFYSNALANRFDGGGGSDTVSYAASGTGVVINLIGQTTFDGAVNDTLSSIENAVGSSLSDTFHSNGLANRFDGGGGIDTVSYAGSNTGVVIDLIGQTTWDGVANDTLSSIENAIGSSLGDTFYSNASANRFDGGGGADTVNYSGASAGVIIDLIGQTTWDGTANDTLSSIENATGSSLGDTFYSNTLANRFDGGGGSDTVSYAGSSAGVIIDLIGQTTFDGTVNDTLSSIENAIGSSLGDTFFSNTLANRFEGGGGTDTVSYAGSSGAVIIDLGGQITWDGVANDTLSSIENAIGSSFSDTFYSNALANRFEGGGGSADTVSYAGSSLGVVIDLIGQTTFDGVVNDTLSSIENATGSSLSDTFHSNALANRFEGGGGIDTVSYAGSSTGVIIDLIGQTTWDGTANDTLSSIENAIGSSLGDTFYSNASANRFDGGGGSDTVSYAGSGTAVNVDLIGQTASDGVVNDTLSSIENAVGSSFSDTFTSNALANRFDGGGGGGDTVSYAGSSTAVIIDLLGQTTSDGVVTDTLSSIENAVGSSFNDTFISNALANRFDGGGGTDTVSYAGSSRAVIIDLGGQVTWDGVVNDTLSSIENAIGSSRNDTIYGDGGNNLLDGGNGGTDSINGGTGIDTVSYASSNTGVIIDLGGQITWDGVANDTLSSIENAIGSSKNDSIYGDGGNNVLDGGNGGTDSINGGTGIDTVSYASSNTGVIIDLGGQITWDGVANDTLSSIENAIGSSKNDTIYGDAGNNLLDGGAGIDFLTGGTGDDTFVFRRGEASEDTIVDFSGNGAATGDQLQFSGYGTAAQGANLTNIDATHWSINSADGTVHDIITVSNGASIHSTDYLFV